MTLDNAMSPEAEDMKPKTKKINSLYRKGPNHFFDKIKILHPVNQCSVIRHCFVHLPKKQMHILALHKKFAEFININKDIIEHAQYLWVLKSKSIFKTELEKLEEKKKRNLDMWEARQEIEWSNYCG